MIAHTQGEALARFKELGNALLDVVFPPRCVACHRLGAWFCQPCVDEIEVIGSPICARCGLSRDRLRTGPRPSHPDSGSVCHRCSVAAPRLDGLRSYAYHSRPLREAINSFKYEGVRILALTLGDLMYQGWLNPSIGIGNVEVIVPVPLHPSREKERGYNQASLLAQHMGACLGIPVAEGLLERSKPTRPQVGLSGPERRKNVRDAFRCVDTAFAGKKILLIDDVCTSGSTLEAACRTLRDVGASSVWAYTLARARGSAGTV